MLHVCSHVMKPNNTGSPKLRAFQCLVYLTWCTHILFALEISVILNRVVQLCLLLSYKCESFRASGKCRHVLFTLAVQENVCKSSALCALTETSAVYTVCYHENQEMKLFPLPSFQNTGPEASEELEVIRQSLAKRHITVQYGAAHTSDQDTFICVTMSAFLLQHVGF